MQVHAHQPLLALLLLMVLLVLLQSWPAAAEHPQAPISASASASASAATPDQANPAAADESASPTPTTTTTTPTTTTTLPDDPDASGLPLLRPIAPPRPYGDPVDEEALTDDAGISNSQQPPCSDQHRHPGSTGDGQGQPSRGCCTSFRQDDSLLPSKMLRAFWGERDPFLGLEEVPTPEGTERVPPSVCGSRRVYWSDSCGAIGTASSRMCSAGGQLVNPKSCASHFEPFSRGCGMLLMGCQAMCMVEEPACEHGQLTFADSHDRTCPTLSEASCDAASPSNECEDGTGAVLQLVAREWGSVGPAAATVSVWAEGGESLATVRLRWADGDNAPKRVRVPLVLQPAPTAVYMQLQNPANATLGRHNVTRIELDCEPRSSLVHPVSFSFQATEQSQTAVLSFERIATGGASDAPGASDQTGSEDGSQRSEAPPLPPARARVVFVGGSAEPHIDYNADPLVVEWAAGEAGVKQVSVPLSHTDDCSTHDTIYATLLQDTGAVVAPAHALLTIHITELQCLTVFETAALEASKAQLLAFTHAIADKYARLAFLDAWRSFSVPPGQTLLGFGEKLPVVLVVADGDVQLEIAGLGEVEHNQRAAPGQLLGFISAISQQPAPITIRTVTTARFWVLSLSKLRLFAELMAKQNFNLVEHMRQQFLKGIMSGRNHKFPLVLVPGFMSTRMTAWRNKPCRTSSINTLDQVWISIEKVMQTVVADKTCWLGCMALARNQTDPSDCKIRPKLGVEAVTELAPGPFSGITTIFRSIVLHFANEWGYDVNQIVPLSYDFRLSPYKLETRDRFFTRMKQQIEMAVEANKLPAVMMAHSLGNTVIAFFFKWLQEHYPDDWEHWTKTHIVSYYGIGAPLIGAVDALLATVNGDTMGLPISHLQARELGATFGSGPWMLPVPANISTPLHQRLVVSPEHAREWRDDAAKQRGTRSTRNWTDSREEQEDAASAKAKQPARPVSALPSDYAMFSDASHSLVFSNSTTANATLFGSLWPDALTIVENADGTTARFNVSEIVGGKIYRHLWETMNDTLSELVLEHIEHYYASDKRPPLLHPPPRPPIDDVAMIYGIDRPTKHLIRLNKASGVNGPALNDTIFELPGGVLSSYNTGETLGHTGLRRSGDGTVTYSSLSWAHSWHLGENVTCAAHPARIVEYYDHLLGQWGERTVFSLMNTAEPAFHRYESKVGYERTTVLEVEGMEHRNSVRDPFAIKLLDSLMMELVGDALSVERILRFQKNTELYHKLHSDPSARRRRDLDIQDEVRARQQREEQAQQAPPQS